MSRDAKVMPCPFCAYANDVPLKSTEECPRCGRKRGWRWPRVVFDRFWVSFCSRHRRFDAECGNCWLGFWEIWRREPYALP